MGARELALAPGLCNTVGGNTGVQWALDGLPHTCRHMAWQIFAYWFIVRVICVCSEIVWYGYMMTQQATAVTFLIVVAAATIATGGLQNNDS